MNILLSRKLLLPLFCSLLIASTVAVPRAHAGIFSFLKRHILGQHFSSSSSSSSGPRKVSAGKDGFHKKKIAGLFSWKHHKVNVSDATASGAYQAYKGSLVDSDSAAIFASSPPRVGKVGTAPPEEAQHFATPPSVANDRAFAGKASWYGPGFAGRRTASGQIFNPGGLTAASRTLPLGSKMLVANPKTGRCCTVTINDRGPYVRGRDIDLSHGAASKIGVTGVSPVVCVAYASNKTPAVDTLYEADSPHLRGRRSSRQQYMAGRNSISQKVTGQVFKLNAGVMPDMVGADPQSTAP